MKAEKDAVAYSAHLGGGYKGMFLRDGREYREE